MEITKETPTSGKVAEYDPAKQYTWKNEDTFVLTGSQFAAILNALRTCLNTREAQAVLLANSAATIVDGLLAEAVETGKVVEKV